MLLSNFTKSSFNSYFVLSSRVQCLVHQFKTVTLMRLLNLKGNLYDDYTRKIYFGKNSVSKSIYLLYHNKV